MTIQIWHAAASVDSEGELERTCRQWLTDEEHERAARFRKPTTRNQFVVGRGMARSLLGSRIGIDPRSIDLQFSAHGKPHLVGPCPVAFNVAHTCGLVVCAIGESERLGVDVESASRRVDTALANRYFSDPEIQWLQNQPSQSQSDAFLRIWTLKESFIKAVGTGLTMPLDRFAFGDIDSPVPRLTLLDVEHGPQTRWHSFLFQPQRDFITAITINSDIRPDVTLHPFG